MLSWESHSGYWLSCGRARTGRAQAASRMRGSVPALSHVIIDRFDFKQSALERLAIVCRRGCATGDRLGPHEAQTVDKRPFCAVQQYAFGLRGMPRFKGYCEPPLDRRQKQRGRDPFPCRQDRVEGPFDPGHVRSSETATAGKSPHSPPRRNTTVSFDGRSGARTAGRCRSSRRGRRLRRPGRRAAR